MLVNDKFTFHNIPNIGSIQNLLQIMKRQGVKYRWFDKNSLEIDSRNVKKIKTLKRDLFYYTSGSVSLIPILASRFGKCIVEKNIEDNNYGGCKIGSRTFQQIIDSSKDLGIDCKETEKEYTFSIVSNAPFICNVPVSSYTVTVNAVYAALFRKGESRIVNFTKEPIFEDVLTAIISTGADIEVRNKELIIKGGKKLGRIDYNNVSDRHEFATWVSAGLSTNSNLLINGVDYERMKLKQLEKVIKSMNIDLEFENNCCKIIPQLKKIQPTTIEAGRYPDFQTEWQVVFSPLLTQVGGKSRVVELLYPDRMAHWKEMKKMGIKSKLSQSIKSPLFAPADEKERITPNVVEITGPQSLYGAKVPANDVRAGAALIIAGLLAKGKTEITGIDQIERGYEDIVERLQKLGVDIRYVSER
jgi:UDP-N-acetylglucosamine 1-carboxyvinyltransferase